MSEQHPAALEYRNGAALCPKCRKHLYNAAACPCGWKAKTVVWTPLGWHVTRGER